MKTALLLAGLSVAASIAAATGPAADSKETNRMQKVTKTDQQWKKELPPPQYRVLRCSDTEPPFTGAYWNHHETGVYLCAACGAPLFGSAEKFDSGTGWPSFSAPAGQDRVEEREDRSHGMVRTEVACARCGSHLGHVFGDGPIPTGLRYCINSASLKFRKPE